LIRLKTYHLIFPAEKTVKSKLNKSKDHPPHNRNTVINYPIWQNFIYSYPPISKLCSDTKIFFFRVGVIALDIEIEINWSVISNRVSVFRKKDLIIKKASNRATSTQMV
jgi:hypothetical protein